MNKRIKIKKSILKKKCSDSCQNYKLLVIEKLITSNLCIGCKHKHMAEKICKDNEKFWNSMTYEEKQKYFEERALNDITKLSNKEFSRRVKNKFDSKNHKYDFREYLAILRAVIKILITQTNNEEIIMKHIIKQVNVKFYSDFITK